MVTNRQTPPELTYDEQVAIARANLERHVADMLAERDQLIAQGIDLDAEFTSWAQEHFTGEELLAAWRDHLKIRGKRLADELEEWAGDMADGEHGRLAG